MRVVAVLIVAAGLAAGVTSLAGSAAASHRAARFSAQSAALPSWSPDGEQIAFVTGSPRRYRIVRTSSKPGGAVLTVLAASGDCCTQLQWVEDGRILVNSHSRLDSVGVQSGKPKRIVFSSCGLQRCPTMGFFLSPNRKYAAAAITNDCSDPHSCGYGIGLVKLRRGREPAVLPSPPFDGGDKARLAFSPDSTQLVYSLSTWDGISPGTFPNKLMAFRLGGSDSVPLAQSGIPGASLVPSDARQLQWSPDGRWVAYVEYDNEGSQQNLEVVPTAGTGTRRELATCNASDFSFSWSPTSKLLAYDCIPEWFAGIPYPSTQLLTVGPDGTRLRDLLKGRHLFADGRPQWSPDGSRLLFVAHRLNRSYPHVWTIRANGRDLTRRG